MKLHQIMKVVLSEGINNNTVPIVESIKTDFYDMYLLSTMPHSDDPEVQALLTDRVDKLIEHFRTALYQAFIFRVDAVMPPSSSSTQEGFEELININDPKIMLKIVRDIINNGDICPKKLAGKYPILYSDQDPNIVGHEIWPYGTKTLGHKNWIEIVEKFIELCNPPNNIKSKIALLDQLFGLAHNNGHITDYLDTPWLYDALYTRALAHPNELARYASQDARDVAKSSDIGYGLGSSLSGYKQVTDADKLNLYYAKMQRPGGTSEPAHREPPRWLLNEPK